MQYLNIKQSRVFPRNLKYKIAKRILDISLCILSTPVLIPIMLLCGLAIWLDSAGPIFFVQDRIGQGGRKFRMYKFRSMHVNQNDNTIRSYMKSYIRGDLVRHGPSPLIFKPPHTRQITRVGQLLRKTSLDEIPQIINVLKGEMSIVGPRPNVPWEVEEYRSWHHERLEVLPGITGLAQVRGRSCIDFISLVRYDIAYVEQKSLLLDLKIIWWTFLSVCTGKGAQ